MAIFKRLNNIIRLDIIIKYGVRKALGLGLVSGLIAAICLPVSISQAIGIGLGSFTVYLFAYINGHVSAYFRSLSKQREYSKRLSREQNEFYELLSLIVAEKNYVDKAIDDFDSFLAHFNASSDSRKIQNFFPDNIKSRKEYSKELRELKEILDQLILLRNDYPDFDSKKISQLAYIEKKYIEFSNHHALVMLLAEEFCKRLHGFQQPPVTRSRLKESSMAFKAVVNPVESKEKISDALAVHGFHPSTNKDDFVPKAADKAVNDKNLFVKR